VNQIYVVAQVRILTFTYTLHHMNTDSQDMNLFCFKMSRCWLHRMLDYLVLNIYFIEALFEMSQDMNLASWYKFGANSLGAAPRSHLESQKRVLCPLPTFITMEQKKMVLSVASVTLRRCLQGMSLWSQLNQSHLSLRAQPNLSRSLIPSPPHFLGLTQVC
jgi:hypothetical protein